MAQGSGLAAQIGAARESTYGTVVAANRFSEFVSESLSVEHGVIASSGLRAGRRGVRTNRQVRNTIGGEGDIEFEVGSHGFGWVFDLIFGDSDETTPALATDTRDVTYTLADAPASYTIQVGRPDVNGTVHPFTYAGCVCPSFELACEVDGILRVTPSVDIREEVMGETLATATYSDDDELLTYLGGSILVDGVAVPVTSFTLSVDLGLKTDRRFIRQDGRKLKPLPETHPEVTAELEVEFDTLALYNRAISGETFPLVATFEGPTEIEAGFVPHVELTLAAVRADGATPNVGGPEVISHALNVTALDDGTNPLIELVYRTSGTPLV
jgi:hypothetical protein